MYPEPRKIVIYATCLSILFTSTFTTQSAASFVNPPSPTDIKTLFNSYPHLQNLNHLAEDHEARREEVIQEQEAILQPHFEKIRKQMEKDTLLTQLNKLKQDKKIFERIENLSHPLSSERFKLAFDFFTGLYESPFEDPAYQEMLKSYNLGIDEDGVPFSTKLENMKWWEHKGNIAGKVACLAISLLILKRFVKMKSFTRANLKKIGPNLKAYFWGEASKEFMIMQLFGVTADITGVFLSYSEKPDQWWKIWEGAGGDWEGFQRFTSIFTAENANHVLFHEPRFWRDSIFGLAIMFSYGAIGGAGLSTFLERSKALALVSIPSSVVSTASDKVISGEGLGTILRPRDYLAHAFYDMVYSVGIGLPKAQVVNSFQSALRGSGLAKEAAAAGEKSILSFMAPVERSVDRLGMSSSMRNAITFAPNLVLGTINDTGGSLIYSGGNKFLFGNEGGSDTDSILARVRSLIPQYAGESAYQAGENTDPTTPKNMAQIKDPITHASLKLMTTMYGSRVQADVLEKQVGQFAAETQVIVDELEAKTYMNANDQQILDYFEKDGLQRVKSLLDKSNQAIQLTQLLDYGLKNNNWNEFEEGFKDYRFVDLWDELGIQTTQESLRQQAQHWLQLADQILVAKSQFTGKQLDPLYAPLIKQQNAIEFELRQN